MFRRPDARLAIERSRMLGLMASMELARLVLICRKYSPDQPRDDRGRWTDTGGDDVDATGSTTPIINEGKTGDLEIDSISEKLAQKLVDVIEALGPGVGPIYGTQVHAAFAKAVRSSGIPGIEVEKTSSRGIFGLPYGTAGSSRTDVLLRSFDDSGSVRAIWDVKTGSATLGPSRANELRVQVGVGRDVPVVEINYLRGTLIKTHIMFSGLGA